MSSRFRNCLLGKMRQESRAAYSELVGAAARGYGLLPGSTEDKGKGCYTKLSILSRMNFIQKQGHGGQGWLLPPLLRRLQVAMQVRCSVFRVLPLCERERITDVSAPLRSQRKSGKKLSGYAQG